MGTAFDTFNQYAFGHYPGQIEDRAGAEIVTKLAIQSDIGFGLAVADIDYRSAALVDSEYTDPTGITVRETVRDNEAGNNPTTVYEEDTEMSVMRRGRIWVAVSDGAAAEDPVYVDPADGTIKSGSTGNTQFPNATFKTSASAGELALVQLDGNG